MRFTFTARPAPVLGRGAPGAFDSHDALNPAVVSRDGVLHNFYSGYDGVTWRTGLATSRDGIEWQKQGAVLSPDPGHLGRQLHRGQRLGAASSTANSGIGTWAAPWICRGSGLARSKDGRAWTKERHPVLDPGPRGSWDERGVADPYAIRSGAYFYLFYLGQDRARRQRLGRGPLDGRRPLGKAAHAIPCSSWARTAISTSRASASPQSGSRTAGIGCSTPAATATSGAAWAWRNRAMA